MGYIKRDAFPPDPSCISFNLKEFSAYTYLPIDLRSHRNAFLASKDRVCRCVLARLVGGAGADAMWAWVSIEDGFA